LKIRKLLIIANFNDGAKKLGYAQDLAATGNNSSSRTLVTATNLDHRYLREIDCSRHVSSE
jgi:hypothetical protein